MAKATTVRTPDRSNWLLFGSGILILAGLVAAVIAARPGARDAAPKAVAPPAAIAAARGGDILVAREPHFDFGQISMRAGKVNHRFWFRNEGPAAVTIHRVYTSCMCTTATLVKGMRTIGSFGMPGHGALPAVDQALEPNEAAYVDVVFDPAAHGPAGLGRTERVVTIETWAGAPLRVAFVAMVTP